MVNMKQVFWKIGIGVGLIVLGILVKRLFHAGGLTLVFHLAGGIMILAGAVQWWMERK